MSSILMSIDTATAPLSESLLEDSENIYVQVSKNSLEFNSVTEAVPSEEWRDIRDEPPLDQTIAIKIGGSPDTLGQVGSSKKENNKNYFLIVKILRFKYL